MTEREIKLNKQYRAQIMRIVAMFYPTPTTVKNIKLGLLEYGMTNQTEISKYLYYLSDKGYIKYSGSTAKGIEDNELIHITADGIDLVEGTTTDDGLYM